MNILQIKLQDIVKAIDNFEFHRLCNFDSVSAGVDFEYIGCDSKYVSL